MPEAATPFKPAAKQRLADAYVGAWHGAHAPLAHATLKRSARTTLLNGLWADLESGTSRQQPAFLNACRSFNLPAAMADVRTWLRTTDLPPGTHKRRFEDTYVGVFAGRRPTIFSDQPIGAEERAMLVDAMWKAMKLERPEGGSLTALNLTAGALCKPLKAIPEWLTKERT